MPFRSASPARWRRAPAPSPTAALLRRVAAAFLVRASRALERLAVAVGPPPPPAWSAAALEYAPSPDGRGGSLYADGVLVGRVDGVRRL
jgi:hypothetical protein